MSQLHTVEEVIKELGIGRTTFYALVKDREIRTVRLGRRVLVPQSEIDALIARKLEESA